MFAFASSGRDTATLIDSAGADNLNARGTRTKLTGPGYSIQLNRFDSVLANARNGGNDRAVFVGVAGNDRFTGRAGTGELRGSGYANKQSGFERVDAFAKLGNDRLDVRNLSYIFRDIGPWIEV